MKRPCSAAWLAVALVCAAFFCPHVHEARADYAHVGHEHEAPGGGQAGEHPHSEQPCPDDAVPHHDHDRCDFEAGHQHTFLLSHSNELNHPQASAVACVLIDPVHPAVPVTTPLRIEGRGGAHGLSLYTRSVRLLL